MISGWSYVCILLHNLCSLNINFFLYTAQLVRGLLNPQRPSGEAVVTGVFLSPLRYVPSILSRIGFSIPTLQHFTIVELHQILPTRSRTFGQSICKKEPLAALNPTSSTTIVTRLTSQPPGTPAHTFTTKYRIKYIIKYLEDYLEVA